MAKSKIDELESEFHEWKHKEELKQAKKDGQWKTCTLAWTLITGFVGATSTLLAQYSKPVYAGLKVFWEMAWRQNP